MTKIQCPNCGGYHTFEKSGFFYDSLKKVRVTNTSSFAIMLLVVPFILIALGLNLFIGFLIFEPSTNFVCAGNNFLILVSALPCAAQLVISEFIALSVFLLLSVVEIHWFNVYKKDASTIKQALKRSVYIRVYHCGLCGYEWQWIEGEPLPQVTVRPELIAKGEERIRRLRD